MDDKSTLVITLNRNRGEGVYIGDDIHIKVGKPKGGGSEVRIAITCPKSKYKISRDTMKTRSDEDEAQRT